MTLKMEQQVERIINIDGMLYKDAAEEVEINQAIIALEKSDSVIETPQLPANKKQNDLKLEKWFGNDYFISPLKVEIHHFIGKESPVLHYVPEFVSDKNSVIQIQGNHENVLEIEGNLEFLIKKII